MYYICIQMRNKMSKTPTTHKAVRAYTLQKVANYEIDQFGKTSTGVFNRLMSIVDNLNEQESYDLLRLARKIQFELDYCEDDLDFDLSKL